MQPGRRYYGEYYSLGVEGEGVSRMRLFARLGSLALDCKRIDPGISFTPLQDFPWLSCELGVGLGMADSPLQPR